MYVCMYTEGTARAHSVHVVQPTNLRAAPIRLSKPNMSRPLNLSLFPPHLRSPPPIPPDFYRPQGARQMNISQCHFTAATQAPDVDIQVSKEAEEIE